MNDPKMEPAHILLVEDNDGDILLTKEAFEECEVKSKISVAKNGKEALDFLHKKGAYTDEQLPDIILLDINIPIFNGHEVLKRIKEDDEIKKIPVIIFTTSTSQVDLDKAYAGHCNCYLKKPLDISEFLQAIFKINEFWLQLTKLSK